MQFGGGGPVLGFGFCGDDGPNLGFGFGSDDGSNMGLKTVVSELHLYLCNEILWSQDLGISMFNQRS